jgi:putative transcriptional regulator
MTPSHHPSDATLLAYAAGSLGEGLSVVVAAHLAFCPLCRDTIAAAEAIGGSLIDELAPEAMSEAATRRLLARLDEPLPSPRPASASPPPVDDPLVPSPLRPYVDRPLVALPWRRLAPGLRHLPLLARGAGGANLWLLRLEAGRPLPRHHHRGTELALVLTGSFADETGRFVRGDVAESDAEAGAGHRPLAGADAECICVLATDAPLAFEGFLARLVQRFSGI